MVEKIRAVNNPLTIVAIFAALAEIAGTVALAAVDKSVQGTFIWFVMGFPLLLVLVFFATLNFNAKVLYAPSDFEKEENFLETIRGTQRVSVEIEKITRELEEARNKIVSLTLQLTAGESARQSLSEMTGTLLSQVEARLASVAKQADVVVSDSWVDPRTPKWVGRADA